MATANTCPACAADEPNNALCKRCTSRLRRDLNELPELMRELDTVLTRQTQAGTGNGGRGAETPMPYDWTASHVRDDVINTITTWVRELDLGDAKHLGASFRAWSRWLTDRTERIRYHTAADQMFDELTYMVNDVRRTVDRPAETTFYGNCTICDRDLYGPADTNEILCRYCDLAGITATYTVDRTRRELWAKAEDRLVPRRVAFTALPVYGLNINAATFRSWIHRGQLEPRIVANGTPLYRLGDVLTLARQKPPTKEAPHHDETTHHADDTPAPHTEDTPTPTPVARRRIRRRRLAPDPMHHLRQDGNLLTADNTNTRRVV